MLLAIIFFLLVPMVFCGRGSVEDYNKLNLVKLDMSDNVYKRLMITNDNLLSATPLAILDVQRLAKYKCYRNIRRNLWTLGIPIEFWNETYMDRIKMIVQQNNQDQNNTSVNVTVLPPS